MRRSALVRALQARRDNEVRIDVATNRLQIIDVSYDPIADAIVIHTAPDEGPAASFQAARQAR